MKDFVDETEETAGTPLNRSNLMAVQGFISSDVQMQENKIIETFSDGATLTTTFNSDGSITEVYEGQRVITKNTKIDGDLIITEVIS